MKILVVLPRFPYPLEKGDKLRAYHQIKELSQHHEVYLFAVSHQRVGQAERDALAPFCKQVEVFHLPKLQTAWGVLRNYFTIRSLQLGYWNTRGARLACRDYFRKVQPDVVYNQMIRTMPLVSKLDCPKVMDFQDALSMNTERRMEQSHGLWRRLLHFEFKMLRSLEYNAFNIFDALTIISDTDADAIPHRRNSDIVIVPNGVDTDYFSKSYALHSGEQAGRPALPAGRQYSLCFCGNMSYAPNVNAAHYLVREIMPLVWKRRPQTTLLLAGAYPKASVRSLASDRVTVSGILPDIRTAYASSSCLVAPMQIGSGLQNKLLEAMAMGLPCITTSIANMPLGAEHGLHLLVGDTPAALADHIVHLLDDPAFAKQIAEQGHQFVLEHFGWTSTTHILEQVLQQACQPS